MTDRNASHGWRSPQAEEARLNARIAVELDPIRRRERVADLRLAAAVTLAMSLVVAEALLAGVPLPATTIDPACRDALDLDGEVVLDEALALRVVAHGPLPGRPWVREGIPARAAA